MKNIIKQLFAFSLLLFFVFMPVLMHAQGENANKPPATSAQSTYDINNTGIVQGCEASGCTFDDFILGIKKVTKMAVVLALSFSVVIIAWAGWLYLTSGGNQGKIDKAHEMFEKVAWGIGWVLAAWLIVDLIVRALVKKDAVTNFIQN